MIISFIKKHAALFVLASIVLCAISAPYLVTENPDSAVFRSGTLGLILLFACYFPAHQALTQADGKTLISACVFGFLFAIALSLGSELYVYGQLLPGFGSLIRRAAVPCMGTPLLGLLAARIMLLSFANHHFRIPLPVFALILFICWLPLLFTYFPAALNYDFPGQVGQYLESQYSDSQPMLHTAFAAAMFSLGKALFADLSAGLLLMTLVQMILFALALAYACSFIQRRGAPGWMVILITGYFALHPLFSVMSISTTKDTLFAGAILVLTLQTYELLEEGLAFFHQKRRLALYILMAVGIALLRSNGLIALILTFPALVIACKGLRKQVTLLCIGCIIAIFASSAAINLAFKPADMSIHQSLSLPAQQLVRAYRCGNLSEDEKAEIKSWYLSDYGLILHPHLADGAKGYLNDDRLHEDMKGFVTLWFNTMLKCPREYVEAFLMLNIGSWYPDDISHANIYRDASYVDLGYLQTIEYDMTSHGIHTKTYLPQLKAVYESICRANSYLEYPIVSQLFNTAIPLWAILFAAFAMIAKKRIRFLPVFLCPIGLWVSYLFFGPCTLARYILPLFACAPPLLVTIFPRKEHHL